MFRAIAFVLAVVAAILLVVGLVADTIVWFAAAVVAAITSIALLFLASRRMKAQEADDATAEDFPDEELPPAAKTDTGLADRPEDADLVDPLAEEDG